MNDYQKKILDEQRLILMNKKSLRYFGILSLWLKEEVFDIGEDVQEDVKILSVIENKTIKYYSRHDALIEDYIYSTIFALLNVLHETSKRSSGKEPELWLMASSHVINCVIRKIADVNNKVHFPNYAVYFEKIEEEYPNATVEEIYELFIRNKQREENSESTTEGDDNSESESQRSSDQEININLPDSKISVSKSNGSDNNIIRIKNQCDNSQIQNSVMIDISHAEISKQDQEDYKSLQAKGTALWKSDVFNEKGYLPSDFVSIIDSWFEIKLPWDNLLQDALRYLTQKGKKTDWSKPNLYLRRPKFKLPGKINKGKNLKYMYVVVDTSASISDENLSTFCSVVISASNRFSSLKLITHDVTIHDELQFKKMPRKDVLFNKINRLTGRGGTSHSHVFKMIEQDKTLMSISVVIFLTDYESDVQTIHSNFRFLEEIPSVWVLTKKHDVNLPNTKAKVIYID